MPLIVGQVAVAIPGLSGNFFCGQTIINVVFFFFIDTFLGLSYWLHEFLFVNSAVRVLKITRVFFF